MASFGTIRFLAAGAAAAVLLQAVSMLPFPMHSLGGFDFVASAAAKERIRFKPTNVRGPLRTAGTGSRGCGIDRVSPVTLMPIVPDRHIGETISARPTFYWYAKGAKVVNFALVERGVPKPILEQQVMVDGTGIARVEIPATAPALVAGKQYRWSVTVPCNPRRPSQDAYTQAFIQRVAPSAQLEQRLAAAKTPEDRARAYADAGIWYDTFATLSQTSFTVPSDQVASQDLLDLLEQVTLSNLVTPQGQLTWLIRPTKSK